MFNFWSQICLVSTKGFVTDAKYQSANDMKKVCRCLNEASSEWWEEKQSKSGCPLSLAGSHCVILCFIIISLTFATVDSAVMFDHPCFYMVVSRVEGVRAGTLSRGRIWLKWRVDLGAGRVGADQYNAHRVLVWWIWGCVVYPEVLWWPFGKSLSIANLIPSVLFSVSLSTNT